MKDPKGPIDILNTLLRGELAAIETYQQALEKVEASEAADLREIHREHVQAANTLRQHVHQHGGEPVQKSGVWGTFAKAAEGAAELLGNRTALKALETGEKQGIRDYEKTLDSPALPGDCQALIRSTLLPRTRAHVPTLERLIEAR